MRDHWRASISGTLLASFFMTSPVRGQETQVEGLRVTARAHPGDLDATLALARALRRAGRSKEAENELYRATALARSSAKALAAIDLELASVYIDRDDFARAFATCQKVLVLAGAAAEGHTCIANADLLQQRASEALVEVSQALSRAPSSYEAHLAEGRAYDLELDTTRAEAALREALALRPDGPDSTEPRIALGRVLLTEGKRDDAIAELRKATEISPSDPDACFALATAIAPGTERTELLERATHERPSFVKAWLALGVDRLEAGRVSEAKEAGEAADRAAPGDVDARLLLGRVALAEGRLDDAVKAGQKVLQSIGNSAGAQLLVADGNAKKGELDLAIEAYQAAWGLDHGRPTALVHASEACHAGGRDTSARAFAVRATQEFPDWAPAWEALGNALAGQGEKQAAREAYTKALAAREGDVDRDAVRRRMAALR